LRADASAGCTTLDMDHFWKAIDIKGLKNVR
jgi:hypothetical protein